MSETVTVAYDGSIAELEITDPQADGRTVGIVECGATIDVPPHVAKDLLARGDFEPASQSAVAIAEQIAAELEAAEPEEQPDDESASSDEGSN